MKAKDYQAQAERTMIDQPDFEISPEQVMLSWNALGLAGEAGEVADLIKKGVFHQQGIDELKLKKELGDVLWYIAAICKQLNISLDEIMQLNIDKLKARFPDGYSPDRTTFKKGMAE